MMGFPEDTGIPVKDTFDQLTPLPVGQVTFNPGNHTQFGEPLDSVDREILAELDSGSWRQEVLNRLERIERRLENMDMKEKQ